MEEAEHDLGRRGPALKAGAEAAGVDIVIHAPYALNVASINNRIRIPSRKLLQQTIDEAAAVGAIGVVVHGGHVTADDDPAAGFVNWRKAIDGLFCRRRDVRGGSTKRQLNT